MTQPFDRDQLHHWFNALVDERISEAEHAQLEKHLKNSEESRSSYLDFLDLHYGLRKIEQQVAEDDFAALRSLATVTRPRSWPRLAVGLLSTAALLAVVISIAFWRRIELRDSHSAMVESGSMNGTRGSGSGVVFAQSSQAAFFGEQTPTLHNELGTGREYALTTGMIELRFPNGATVIVEAPALFSIADDARLELQSGRCSVHAPEGAEGFRVDTPLTEIVDLGTRFSVAVDETGETVVQVIEGAAEVLAKAASHHEMAPAVRLVSQEARAYSDDGTIFSSERAFDDSLYRGQLPDRVISYQMSEPKGNGVVELTALLVQRGGARYSYPVEELIGIELTHFKSGADHKVCPIAYPLEGEIPSVESIVADRALNTGIINPGGAVEPWKSDPIIHSPEQPDSPNTVGMAIRFLQPIVNQAGPDLVLFDLQTYANPVSGDAFHIGPVHFEGPLRTHTVRNYDIPLNSSEAKLLERFGLLRYSGQVHSLDELVSLKGTPSKVHTSFRALAVGVDLSNLGFPLNAIVEQLFIQDAMDDPESFVDPTLIVGLPEIRSSPDDPVKAF